ncbi:MAG: alanine--tRNA ligase [Alphaproteobacteria bacterium]|nr:alanine--tRNA ligase [Alphaproteobacteria bacterium]
MKTLTDIRTTFLDTFKSANHSVVESSPLVPRNDPTLMFTNSGMVQFKNIFTGAETRPYTRATTAQKCVRAGGKHNDLENVGYTARHHTFFEMLGNFSFGDYFKDVAIELAWNLITKEYGLPKEKLLVTVFADDDQAAGYWKKIAGLSDDKIIRIPTSDNFWQMGDTGPCGPCSEIFYDHGPKVAGGPPGSADQDGDRFIEIWNLVFMQYEQLEPGKRIPLPKPSIDTGMGLERLAAVLQGVHSNYETDLFMALINLSADLTKVKPEGASLASHRVIADHLRASSFLIADGVMPGNEGRGYVLRRIMRRAMRHAHILGAKEPLMYRLLPELVKLMGAAYPELIRAQPLISETLKLEETRFKQTLDRGLKLLEEEAMKLSGKPLAGDVAFKLYDTYGFPLDLTQDVLRGKNLTVDTEGFNAAMERQKAEARKSWAGSGDAATSRIWFELREEIGATEFLGYSTEKAEGQVKAIVIDGKKAQSANAGQKVSIVINQTPFYGESGGQVGDTGVMTLGDTVIRVDDTKKEAGDVLVHHGVVEKGNVKIGDGLNLLVNHERRSAIRANHSATHLMHEALRRVLGEHVSQKGSQVTPDRLRFDFSHSVSMTAEQRKAVEDMVNDRIRANEEVITRILTPDEAMKEGAMALFGEKYDDEVRVLSMGGFEEGKTKQFSMELCGGTHVKRTGDIGLFKIISESAVAAGIRRVEAVTGIGALAYFNEQERVVQQAAEALRVNAGDVATRIASLVEDYKKIEKELSNVKRQALIGGETAGEKANKKIGDITYVPRIMNDVAPKDLKSLVDALKQQRKEKSVIVLLSSFEGKVNVVVGVTEDMTGQVNAVNVVKQAVQILGGTGGGGRPDMAQGGGSDPNKMSEAISAIEDGLKKLTAA